MASKADSASKAASNGADAEAVTIKKYANRRLYNTATSSYVTLDHLCQMVKQGIEFVVYDAKSGEDITRSVLTQIIFEEEQKSGQNLLPIRFLRHLIRFYGDNLQMLVPGYLEMSMEAFTRNREQFREQMTRTWGGEASFRAFEEMTRQNMQLFENALAMFNPFQAARAASAAKPAEPEAREGSEDDLAELKAQLLDMQRRLNELSGDSEN